MWYKIANAYNSALINIKTEFLSIPAYYQYHLEVGQYMVNYKFLYHLISSASVLQTHRRSFINIVSKKSMAPSTLLWLSLLQTLTFVNIALPTVTLNLLILKNLNPVVCCLWLYFSYKKCSWLTVLKALWKAKYIMSTG